MYSLTLALVFRDENLSQLDSTKQTNKTALNFNDIKRWAQGWSLGWIHDNSTPFLLNSSFFIFAGKCLKRFPIIRISFHTSTESSFRGIKNESTAQVMDECSFRTIHLFRWFLCYVCVLSLLEHRGKSRGVPNDRYLASYVPLVTGARFLYWLIVLLRLRLWEKVTSGGLRGRMQFKKMETHVNSLHTLETLKE